MKKFMISGLNLKEFRDHLMIKSNTQDLINKYILLRSCTNNLPNNIKPFQERENDITIYYHIYLFSILNWQKFILYIHLIFKIKYNYNIFRLFTE